MHVGAVVTPASAGPLIAPHCVFRTVARAGSFTSRRRNDCTGRRREKFVGISSAGDFSGMTRATRPRHAGQTVIPMPASPVGVY